MAAVKSRRSQPDPFTVTLDELDRIVDGWHHDPHAVLGPHPTGDGRLLIRVLRPDAESVTLVTAEGEQVDRREMTHEHRGIWRITLPTTDVPHYGLDVEYEGQIIPGDDPYRFWPTLGEMDLYLIGEGRHEDLWKVLGAHRRTYDSPFGPLSGVSFAVWAPNARGVRVVGDFNHWDGTAHPMRSLGSAGVWEIFVPGIDSGVRYKFAILGPDGHWRQKADPMAFATEVPPATASVAFTTTYSWQDQAWIQARAEGDPHRKPISIYELHLGSWRPGLDYRQLATELVEYVTECGFTHVELLPVAEHPYGPSWGYQVTSYYAPTARFGSPDDLRMLIDSLHQAGIGVLVYWVPAHFPKDGWGMARIDGTALYEHADARRGEHPDWGTYVFDFGRPEVRNFLVANALFWLEEFHIDGLRVDAVASMLYLDYSRGPGQWEPNTFGGRENLEAVAFLQELNATIYRRVPGAITIAEESTAWGGVTRPTFLGGLGFGFKWNMGWMHDSLDYLRHEPIHRQYHHNQMTFAMMYAYSERYVLPISHDEVVHGKGSLIARMPGDRWQQLANLRAFLGFMWAHPGRKLLFMGSEFAQSSEWDSERGLEWWLLQFQEHSGILRTVSDLNRVYRELPPLWELDDEPAGFSWIEANDHGANVFSWLRFDRTGAAVACLVNLSPVPRTGYRIGLPWAGTWSEVLNTDAKIYGGSGMGNLGEVQASTQRSWHGRPASAEVTLPPLATVYLASSPG